MRRGLRYLGCVLKQKRFMYCRLSLIKIFQLRTLCVGVLSSEQIEPRHQPILIILCFVRGASCILLIFLSYHNWLLYKYVEMLLGSNIHPDEEKITARQRRRLQLCLRPGLYIYIYRVKKKIQELIHLWKTFNPISNTSKTS